MWPLPISKLECYLAFVILFLLSQSTPSLAQSDSTTDSSTGTDGKFNFLGYTPSNTLTGIAFVLILGNALCQTYLMWKRGGKFMLAMLIAEYTFAIGFAARFALHSNPFSKGTYIIENLLVLLSPCGFIAANYMLLGRLATLLQCSQYLLVPARRITLVFVLSDVFTFLMQSTGGSLQIIDNESTRNLGSHVFLGGLILQLISFVFFTFCFVKLLLSVHNLQPQIWNRDAIRTEWYNDWRSLAFALSVSCAGIIVRSVYRTIEASQGFGGKFATTESLFYALDTLPLFIAIAIFTPFWPGRYIPGKVLQDWEGLNRYGNISMTDV
ncbi:RTA1-like protein [Abortiporus biennis]|nr:RTA1-like protein [Abortiporus biennis]